MGLGMNHAVSILLAIYDILKDIDFGRPARLSTLVVVRVQPERRPNALSSRQEHACFEVPKIEGLKRTYHSRLELPWADLPCDQLQLAIANDVIVIVAIAFELVIQSVKRLAGVNV